MKGRENYEDEKDSTVNLNNYLEELNKEKNKKDCDVTNIEKLNDINAEITISGKYKFIAKDEENGNVKIIYLGEAGGLQISPTEATYRYPTAGTFEVINNESQGKLTVKSSNEEIESRVSFGMFFYRRPRSWLRESIHAPIGPPFFPSLENFRAVSLLTMLRE